MLERFAENPLIQPRDVKPSRADVEVMCAFNPGATTCGGETVLLVRVAERPIPEKGWVKTAVMDPETPGEYRVIAVRENDPDLDAHDPRVFTWKGTAYLTSISHLRRATSRDGRHFTVEEAPALMPATAEEVYGIEDARIVQLEGAYYVSYSAISPRGVTTCLARTTDLRRFERLGVMFCPDNKDIAIFPEKIGGRYYAFHRPNPGALGRNPAMWLASSPNLRDWGHHRYLLGARPGKWDSERTGCGASPIKTDRGWLQFYHASDYHIRYCSGAVLLDLEEPWKVLARSVEPILQPQEPYETSGFMPNVCFHNGLVERGDGTVDLYYGAADWMCCGATVDIQAVLDSLTACSGC